MSNILLQDVAQYLQENSLGTRGTDIFLSGLPDDEDAPNLLTVLSEYGGVPSKNRLIDAARNIQVLVRGNQRDYEGGHTRIWAVYRLIADPEKRYITFTSGRRANIAEIKQTPEKIEDDELLRPIFIFNFSIWTTSD